MDISQAVSGYITKMVSTGDAVQSQAASKMKILLLDNETVCSLTTFISHSRLTPV
jgi:vacuolar protein sorting-associated protein 45